jgi:hypothetical protein
MDNNCQFQEVIHHSRTFSVTFYVIVRDTLLSLHNYEGFFSQKYLTFCVDHYIKTETIIC